MVCLGATAASPGRPRCLVSSLPPRPPPAGAASGRHRRTSISRLVRALNSRAGPAASAHIMFRVSEDEWALAGGALPELWVRLGLVFCTLCMVLIQSARLPERNLHSFNLPAPEGSGRNEKPGVRRPTWLPAAPRPKLLIRAHQLCRRRTGAREGKQRRFYYLGGNSSRVVGAPEMSRRSV